MEPVTVCRKVRETICTMVPVEVRCKVPYTVTEEVPVTIRKRVPVCVEKEVCVRRPMWVEVPCDPCKPGLFDRLCARRLACGPCCDNTLAVDPGHPKMKVQMPQAPRSQSPHGQAPGTQTPAKGGKDAF
jgi:hypothetical protein